MLKSDYGTRVYLDETKEDPAKLKSGEYTLYKGIWWAVPPGHPTLLCNLFKHTVVEHLDGTITVSPSIAVSTNTDTWHGFLEQGIWREC